MAEEQKKKRSRFGEEFHELFPQLILPAALGLISSYNPQATAGVRTGLAAADLFSDLRERKRQQALEETASAGMTDWIERRREATARAEDDLRTAKGTENLVATLENTGKSRPGGATIAVAFPPGSTEREQADQVPYFHEAVQLPQAGGAASLPAFAGLEPFGNLVNEPMGQELLPIAKEQADVSEMQPSYDFLDIMGAQSILNPAAAASQAGWWQYQEQGHMNEMERMIGQYHLMDLSDASRHHLKTAEIKLRAGERVAAERELALIHPPKPVVYGGGALVPKSVEKDYTLYPTPPSAGGRAGVNAYLSEPMEKWTDAQLDRFIITQTKDAAAIEKNIGDTNEEVVQQTWALLTEALAERERRRRPAGGVVQPPPPPPPRGTTTTQPPSDIPAEFLGG